MRCLAESWLTGAVHDSSNVEIGQPSYTEKILQWYKMHDCKAVSTPVNPDLKLVAAENPKDVLNQQMYQAIVGSLLYLSTKTRSCEVISEGNKVFTPAQRSGSNLPAHITVH